MTYVRTITDRYGIEIIIDVTDNEEFVKTHKNDWKKVSNNAVSGNFLYEGKAISPDDAEYTAIQEIIFNEVEKENEILRAKEEEERIRHEQELEAARLELENDEESTNDNG